MSMKPAESFSVRSSQRHLLSFGESSFHSGTLLQATYDQLITDAVRGRAEIAGSCSWAFPRQPFPWRRRGRVRAHASVLVAECPARAYGLSTVGCTASAWEEWTGQRRAWWSESLHSSCPSYCVCARRNAQSPWCISDCLSLLLGCKLWDFGLLLPMFRGLCVCQLLRLWALRNNWTYWSE